MPNKNFGMLPADYDNMPLNRALYSLIVLIVEIFDYFFKRVVQIIEMLFCRKRKPLLVLVLVIGEELTDMYNCTLYTGRRWTLRLEENTFMLSIFDTY